MTMFFGNALTVAPGMIGAAAAAGEGKDYSNLFVVLLGVGTVFVGLIGIIGLIKLMSLLVRAKGTKAPVAAPAAVAAPAVSEEIPNRQELIAAVSAVAAEELGTDVSAIRILSFKKV